MISTADKPAIPRAVYGCFVLIAKHLNGGHVTMCVNAGYCTQMTTWQDDENCVLYTALPGLVTGRVYGHCPTSEHMSVSRQS